ncbi:class I SAM-dependent methyltransferase [Microbacterium aurantiacum]|uniref:SAM-dependent methyltransferase n=1 Tax=Microbacterium aurantiacum TaxID=162393 RepID=A0A0M8MN60_9MICO|nr:class I SAM-dependent methyltransferase [Microbacterium chocolatum]ANG85084.1 SAM-dependent methyltransferase [Microbacterium chocolatum]KOS10201.1 SAM-dependent methyltransferase [Microbacterium chocolatum]
MDMAELTALLTPDGLRLLDETPAVGSADDVARTVSRLRAAGHSPDLVSAVVGQARLRARAKTKFGDFASRMLFTRAGLEQATRLSIAAAHAGRFQDAGIRHVFDLGCGIGGDALGLAALGMTVDAVDADEVTAAIAAYNLAPFGEDVRVRHARAEDEVADLGSAAPEATAVWLDPARRTAGHSETSRTRPEDWSPSLEWAFDLAARVPAGIKLGPGLDRALIPDDVEAQWVSVDGSTLELILWSGALARDGVRRAALVFRGKTVNEIRAAEDSPDEPARELGAFLHEPDGAVIRARLIGDVARSLEAGMLDPQIAYLTSDAALTSPFVQSFRVREELPTDAKALARALRERGIGTLEIKKRGVDVDPAALRTKLKLRGDESATLLLTRVGTTRRAILADRV